jgi:hypothetical protein
VNGAKDAPRLLPCSSQVRLAIRAQILIQATRANRAVFAESQGPLERPWSHLGYARRRQLRSDSKLVDGMRIEGSCDRLGFSVVGTRLERHQAESFDQALGLHTVDLAHAP